MLGTPLTTWTLRVDPDGPTPVPRQASALIGTEVVGHVPGAVHGDLLDAGLIVDPLLDDNEYAVAWVSETDWVYECAAAAPVGHERVDLVFEGIDTFARIEVDGVEIGTTRNMHRGHRFDVTGRLTGSARIAVHLTSAYTAAAEATATYGSRPGAYTAPFNMVRKMACSFGWDWGPTVVGAGIWRPARLECWSTARVAGVRALVDVLDGTGTLTVLLDVERAASGIGKALAAEIVLDGVVVAGADLRPGVDSIEVSVDVPAVRIWQPVGYGEPELYDLRVRLLHGDAFLDDDRSRIGFRRLELDRSADDVGSQFVFGINGQPVLVKGVNWIPGDVLPGRMTGARYRARLRQAVDAGVNLIRVWGGGLYENDDFYDLCDALGLLVWQDFAFACAAYPEDEPLRSEVRAEAAENVARLAGHPSLVLWNGNNECLWLHEADRWVDLEGGQLPWGERYYLEDLPAIVAAVDPSRPYTAGSPWSGSWAYEPNDPDQQTMHSWDVWNRQDFVHYRDSTPRFVAEFGWQAPPAWLTLREAVSDDPITPDSKGVRHHQKAQDGNGKLWRGLDTHYPLPATAGDLDVDAWHFLTQLNQVRAVETGVSHWRSHWPHTAGTILWQLNDLWSVISWAAIDGAGRRKPLYHALSDLYAERLLTLQPTANGLDLCALNDSAAAWLAEVPLRRIDDAGAVLAEDSVLIEVAARSVQRLRVPEQIRQFRDPASEVVIAATAGSRALWYGIEPADGAFGGVEPTVEIRPVDGGLEVVVSATSLVRDVLVQPDRIHPAATADRGFVTVLPGESEVVRVDCPEPLAPSDASGPYAVTWLDRVLGQGRR